ncbi:MAG: complement resistance protein TraT [Nitrospira sp.]|nr:complement resistance protein TraT [Nitrospira sp.]
MINISLTRLTQAITMALGGALLAGCAGHMTLSKEIQVKTSSTIFLQPTSDKTVFVSTKNTSGNPDVELVGLKTRLASRGFQLVEDPDKAHTLVQVNTVYCDKSKPGTTLDTLLAGGFGSGIGAAAGTAAALSGAGMRSIPIAGAVGGLVGMGLAKATEDTVYVCAADVQVIERTDEVVQQQVTTNITPTPQAQPGVMGLLGGLNQQSLTPPSVPGVGQTMTEVRTGKQRIHQTRVVAGAQQMWLNLKEASVALREHLTEAISGML